MNPETFSAKVLIKALGFKSREIMAKAKKVLHKRKSLMRSFFILCYSGPILFFVGKVIYPAAEKLILMVDTYPASVSDWRVWFVLSQIVLWSLVALILGLLALAATAHIVSTLQKKFKT